MPDWALALCHPGGERAASRLLDRLSYPHLWFKQRRTAVVRGRVVERFLPAFPRYIWVPWDMGWSAVRDCPRLVRLLELGGVSADIVDSLLDRCGGGDVFPPDAERSRFREGDRVRIGGFAAVSGQVGIYQRTLVDGHAIVLLPWLGQWAPASIAESDLEADRPRLVGKYGGRKRYRYRRLRRQRAAARLDRRLH